LPGPCPEAAFSEAAAGGVDFGMEPVDGGFDFAAGAFDLEVGAFDLEDPFDLDGPFALDAPFDLEGDSVEDGLGETGAFAACSLPLSSSAAEP